MGLVGTEEDGEELLAVVEVVDAVELVVDVLGPAVTGIDDEALLPAVEMDVDVLLVVLLTDWDMDVDACPTLHCADPVYDRHVPASSLPALKESEATSPPDPLVTVRRALWLRPPLIKYEAE